MEERRALRRCGGAQVAVQHRSSSTGSGQLDQERSRHRHRILARVETAVDENVLVRNEPRHGHISYIFRAEVVPGLPNAPAFWVTEDQSWQQQGDQWRLISVER